MRIPTLHIFDMCQRLVAWLLSLLAGISSAAHCSRLPPSKAHMLFSLLNTTNPIDDYVYLFAGV